MAKETDPNPIPSEPPKIPGLKGPVWNFEPMDHDGHPQDVDRFNRMIRRGRETGHYDLNIDDNDTSVSR